jgi:hypothetical protein
MKYKSSKKHFDDFKGPHCGPFAFLSLLKMKYKSSKKHFDDFKGPHCGPFAFYDSLAMV